MSVHILKKAKFNFKHEQLLKQVYKWKMLCYSVDFNSVQKILFGIFDGPEKGRLYLMQVCILSFFTSWPSLEEISWPLASLLLS